MKHHDRRLECSSRELRRTATLTERILGPVLRNRRCGGLSFRRRHMIGPFRGDIFGAGVMRVVERDGERDPLPADRERLS